MNLIGITQRTNCVNGICSSLMLRKTNFSICIIVSFPIESVTTLLELWRLLKEHIVSTDRKSFFKLKNGSRLNLMHKSDKRVIRADFFVLSDPSLMEMTNSCRVLVICPETSIS